MADARHWLEFFYGHFFDGENENYVSPPDVDMALLVAVDWRPECLLEDQQNQAQAHYAAYVLDFRQRVRAAGLSVSSAMSAAIAGPAIEIQEGSTRVRYSEKAASSQSVSQIQSTMTGPGTAYAAWFELWRKCTGEVIGGGTGSGSSAVVPRGAIISRYGWQV